MSQPGKRLPIIKRLPKLITKKPLGPSAGTGAVAGPGPGAGPGAGTGTGAGTVPTKTVRTTPRLPKIASPCLPLVQAGESSSVEEETVFSWSDWEKAGDKLAYAARLRVQDLAQLLLDLSSAYYNAEPLVSDAVFDKIQEVLGLLAPNHPVLQRVGAEIPDSQIEDSKMSFKAEDFPQLIGTEFTNPLWRQKIRLPFLMPSMDKVKPKDISKWGNWVAENPAPYNISDKIDGMSAGLIYTFDPSTGSIRIQLTSRGDGIVGEDLSAILPYLSVPGGSLPISPELEKMIQENGWVGVRGEIVIPIEEFEKTIGKGYALRNVARGIIGGKTLRTGLLSLVDFISYEVVHPWPKTLTEGLSQLENMGFHVVYNEQLQTSPTLQELREILLRRRRDAEYEIDGLIVTQDSLPKRSIEEGDAYPDYAIAFKFDTDSEDTESALSIVRTVQWNISKDGRLYPVAVIKPVGVGGVTIENVTLHNAAHVRDMGIGPGAIVRVTRGGDVIPQIVWALRPVRPQMPTIPYVWNETGRSISLLDPELDPSVMLCRVQYFFKKLGVSNWGDANVRKVVDSNLPLRTDILDVLDMTVEDLEQLPGIKTKMAEKLWKSLHEKLSRVDLTVLMAASNLFGSGIGSRRLQSLFDAMPDFLRQPYRTEEDRSKLLQRIIEIPGFQEKTGSILVQGLPYFIPFLYGIYRSGWISTFLRKPGQLTPEVLFPAAGAERSLGDNIDDLEDTLKAIGRAEYDQADYNSSSEIQSRLLQAMDKEKAESKPKITRLPALRSGTVKPVKPAKPTLVGKTIVFTGVFKGLEEQTTARGGQVSKSLSGRTDILVKKDANWTSGKVTKAEKLGTKIMTADEFRETYL